MTQSRDAQRFRKVYGFQRPEPRPEVMAAGPSVAGDQFWYSTTTDAIYTTGSVIIRGGETTFDAAEDVGTDVFFFVSGSITGSGSDDHKAVFGGDVVMSGSAVIEGDILEVSGALIVLGDTMQFTGSMTVTGTVDVSGSFTNGSNVFAGSLFSHAEGSAAFTTDVFTSISVVSAGPPAQIFVTDNSSFSVGDKVAYVYNAGGGNNQVHVTEVTNIPGPNVLDVNSVVPIDVNTFWALTISPVASQLDPIGGIPIGTLFKVSPTGNKMYSHAEGGYVLASGLNSHAEGRKSAALGAHSHAEGVQTIARGEGSHSEGYRTLAIGRFSHAGGYRSIAAGISSNAAGEDNTSGLGFVESFAGVVTGVIRIDNPGGDFTANFAVGRVYAIFDNTSRSFSFDVVTGVSYDSGANYTSITGSLSDLKPGNLRVFDVNDPKGIAELCTTGVGTSGGASSVEGAGNFAIGDASHAEGENTYAVGSRSHAEGYGSRALGDDSHAEGNDNIVYSDYSHGEGDSNVVVSSASHAEGYLNNAGARMYTMDSLTAGTVTLDSSYGDVTARFSAPGTVYIISTALSPDGLRSYRLNYSGVSFSSPNTVLTLDSTLTLPLTSPAGWLVDSGNLNDSYADSQLTSYITHVEGLSNTAIGQVSHVEGGQNVAVGIITHVEGAYNTAFGVASHAEGIYNTSEGNFSHVEGSGSFSVGDASHAGGICTIASGSGQMAIGKWNKRDNVDSLFVVGDGTGDEDANRSDIFRIDGGLYGGQGTVQITGSLDVVGDAVEVSGTFDTTTSASFYSGKVSIGYDVYAPGLDVFLFVSGSSGSMGTAERGVAAFGGDVVVSGSLKVGTGSVKITSNDIQFSGPATRIEKSGNDLMFYDASVPTGVTLSNMIGGGGGNSTYSQTFVWDDLAGGVLSVNHNLSDQYVSVVIYDDTSTQVMPDSVIATSTTSLDVDLTSFGSFAGTWNIIVLASNATLGGYTNGFVVGDLEGGVLTVNHNLNNQYVSVVIYDENDDQVIPDSVVASSPNSAAVDLTSFGSFAGTWHVMVLRTGPSNIGGPSYFDSVTAGSIYTSESAAFVGDGDELGVVTSPSNKGGDIFFYVSGSISGSGADDKKALFGGDVRISGSLSQGSLTTAAGYASHAEGAGTEAVGIYSHAEGFFTIASGSYQHAGGSYNKRDNNFSLFVIGDGVGDADVDRSDIVRVNPGASPGLGRFQVTGSVEVSGSYLLNVASGTVGSNYNVSLWDHVVVFTSNNVTATLPPTSPIGAHIFFKDGTGNAGTAGGQLLSASIGGLIDGTEGYTMPSVDYTAVTLIKVNDSPETWIVV